MILQYGYIIHRNKHWNKFTLRLVQILPDRAAEDRRGLIEGSCVGFEEEYKRLDQLLEEVRVDASTKVVGIPAEKLDPYRDREDFCRV